MRELILHVGPTKTGSSYLQKMLVENRDALKRRGLTMGPGQDPATGSHLPLLERMAKEGCAAVLPEIIETPGDRILLSAEDFNQFFTETSPNGRPWTVEVMDAFRDHFILTIVFVVRRQDQLKESRFAEAVKGSFNGDIREHGLSVQPHAEMDLSSRIAALEDSFGKASIRIVPYSTRGSGDLMDTFLSVIGAQLDPGDRRDVPPQNVAMHRRKVLFLSQIPKHRLASIDRGYWFPASFIARQVAQSKAVRDDKVRNLLSPAERHALVSKYRESNAELVARYGIDDCGDFLDLPDPTAPWAPPAPISWSEYFSVWRQVVGAAITNNPPLRALNVSVRSSALFARMGGAKLLARPHKARGSDPAAMAPSYNNAQS